MAVFFTVSQRISHIQALLKTRNRLCRV